MRKAVHFLDADTDDAKNEFKDCGICVTSV